MALSAGDRSARARSGRIRIPPIVVTASVLGPTVRVVVDEHRSQTRNRVLAHERLRARLASALHVEAPRRATKPSRGSKERRLKAKKQRSDTKANRRRPTAGDH